MLIVVFFFFYIKGGALRVNELRLACANRLKCNAHGPTMNLFERFSRVVKVPACLSFEYIYFLYVRNAIWRVH